MAENSLITGKDGHNRCWWCGNDPLYVHYHDEEWGKPVYDDVRLFEKLCLEGFQAGLSWLTILRKRDNFRAAFADFDFAKVAKFNENNVLELLQNSGIIRHRGKIEATINNAQRALDLLEECGSLTEYFWSFKPDGNTYTSPEHIADIHSQTPASQALSKDLKLRGWRFVGPTTCYAFMQAMGMVNDHVQGCYCR
jgi:DNA-3-methyladenine glycosylase I